MLDWDVHHGNGTNAIFRESPRGAVREHPPVRRSSPARGRCPTSAPGAGEGYSINLPVPAGSGEEELLRLVEHVVAAGGARRSDPDLVLMSAGYDAHRDDPLGRLRARDRLATRELARQVARARRRAGVRLDVLEGGYDLDALAASVAATMEALAAGGEPRPRSRAARWSSRRPRPSAATGIRPSA